MLTYHIYDDLSRKIYTVPPKAYEELAASTFDVNEPAVAELIYSYEYDDQGRMTSRKIPGKGTERLVYDPLGRVALAQDAQLAVHN